MENFKELFETAEVSAVFLIPVVAGFVQAFKLAFTIQDRFLPFIHYWLVVFYQLCWLSGLIRLCQTLF